MSQSRVNYTDTHDPLCVSRYPALISGADCSWCQIIGKVRADEQAKRESFRP